MKKRTIAFMLTCCTVGMLAACGSADTSTTEPVTTTENNTYNTTESLDVTENVDQSLTEVYLPETDNDTETVQDSNIDTLVFIVEGTENYLALRTEPATDQSNEIGKLHNGDTFYVEYFTDNGFAYGKTCEDHYGYVNASYLLTETEYNADYNTGISPTSEYTYDGEDIPPMDYTSAELLNWNSGDVYTSTDLLTGKWQEDCDSNDIYIEFSYDGSQVTWYMYSMVSQFGDTYPFEFNSGVAYVYYEDGFGYYMECMSGTGNIYQSMDLSDITDGTLYESDGDIFYKIG